jgi:hypothetical protein
MSEEEREPRGRTLVIFGVGLAILIIAVIGAAAAIGA